MEFWMWDIEKQSENCATNQLSAASWMSSRPVLIPALSNDRPGSAVLQLNPLEMGRRACPEGSSAPAGPKLPPRRVSLSWLICLSLLCFFHQVLYQVDISLQAYSVHPKKQHRLGESRKLLTKPKGVKSLSKDIIFLKKMLVNKLSILFIKNSVEMKLCVVIMSKCLYLQRSVAAWMESYWFSPNFHTICGALWMNVCPAGCTTSNGRLVTSWKMATAH